MPHAVALQSDRLLVNTFPHKSPHKASTSSDKMVDGTRSGRATRAKAEKSTALPKTPKAKAAKPQGVTKAKAKPPPKKDGKIPTGPKAGRGGKGKGKRGAVSAAADVQATTVASGEPAEQDQAPETTPRDETKATPTAPALAPPPNPKVTRIYNEIWGSSLESIAFVQEGDLATDEDTTTITLNLIDHVIKPENWNPDLSYNVLSATCFFFASKITGLRHTPGRIASAMKVDVHLIEAMAGPQVHYNPVVRARLAEALRVGPEDVKKGYGILFAQKEGLKEYVGEYAKELDNLPQPDELGKMEVMKAMANMGWKDGEGLGGSKQGIASPIRAANRSFPEAGLGWYPEGIIDPHAKEEQEGEEEEAVIEAEKASEVELDPSELDDFDRFVEENE